MAVLLEAVLETSMPKDTQSQQVSAKQLRARQHECSRWACRQHGQLVVSGSGCSRSLGSQRGPVLLDSELVLCMGLCWQEQGLTGVKVVRQ